MTGCRATSQLQSHSLVNDHCMMTKRKTSSLQYWIKYSTLGSIKIWGEEARVERGMIAYRCLYMRGEGRGIRILSCCKVLSQLPCHHHKEEGEGRPGKGRKGEGRRGKGRRGEVWCALVASPFPLQGKGTLSLSIALSLYLFLSFTHSHPPTLHVIRRDSLALLCSAPAQVSW